MEKLFFSKVNMKSQRDSSLVNKAGCGAVPRFLFPGNPEPAYTFEHLHCHEKGSRLLGRLHVCCSHFPFHLKTHTLFVWNLSVLFRALVLKFEQRANQN